MPNEYPKFFNSWCIDDLYWDKIGLDQRIDKYTSKVLFKGHLKQFYDLTYCKNRRQNKNWSDISYFIDYS